MVPNGYILNEDRGLTNYSKVSENCIEPLIMSDQGIILAPNIRLSEELFIFPADGTIFVSQMEDLLLKDLDFRNLILR